MLTPEQIEIRRTRISASDAGAVLGLNPWKSPADVQVEKLYEVEPLPETEEMAIGNMIERPLIEWAARKLGHRIVAYPAPGTIISERWPWLCATPDSEVDDRALGYEGKTSGIVRGWHDVEQWGEERSAEIPSVYQAQVYVQMAVRGYHAVFVPALLAGRGRAIFELPRANDEIEGLIDVLHDWRERHIVKREPCESLPNVDTLKRIVRRPKVVKAMPGELVRALDAAKERAAEAEAAEKTAKAAFLTALADGEAARSEDGCYTFFQTSRKVIDADLLYAKYPEVASECEKTIRYRTLRKAKRV